ncbi:MAG TPA: hypothetical protein VD789_10755 [Thermomicrobiales bacterium]|nr:hypothetical protein [Thermomicrobiales bacterium]
MTDWLDFAVITAGVLAFAHAAGPWIRSHLGRHAQKVQSFGGGVGLGYVFLALFPEIDLAHDWLGRHVHLVTLVSFLVFFAIEARLVLRARSQVSGAAIEATPGGDVGEATVFWFHIGILALYTSLMVFTLPDRIAGDLLFALAGGLAIGVHCIYKDYILRSRVEHQYQAAGRYLLALAPLAGWVARHFVQPSEAVLDIGMAILAGVLIQSVFRDEIPTPDVAVMRWLFAGVATFALLSMVT